MAQALRPSAHLFDKQNVNPSINRTTEVTAEDFHEIANIVQDHALKIDGINRAAEGSKFYGFFSTLPLLEASFPVAEENGFAVIDPGTGDPQTIATFKNGAWSVPANQAPIQFYTSKVARDTQVPEGQSGIWYIVLDEKIAYLWHNGGYIGFGKDGNNGLDAYDHAVALGFEGSLQDWIDSLKGKDNYQLWLDAGNVGTYEDYLLTLKGPPGDPGDPGEPGAGFENIPATPDQIAVTDGQGGIIWEPKPTGGTATAPVAYATMADMYAAQANQVANGSYRVDNAIDHPDILDPDKPRAWFDYKGTTVGDHTDYILRSEEESLNLDAQLAAIENRLTALEGIGGVVPIAINTVLSRATHHKKKLFVTANVTITYPAAGLGGDFECNTATSEAGQVQFLDENATPGNDLDAPDGTLLEARKMVHLFERPDDGRLSIYGDVTA